MLACLSKQLIHYIPWNERIDFFQNYELKEHLSDPNLQLCYSPKSEGEYRPLLTVEIGFSQPSEDLENTIKAYLERTSVKVALMFDFKESPKYKNPFVTRKAAGKDRAADQKSWLNRENLEYSKKFYREECIRGSFCLENNDPYSPELVNGLRWAGGVTGLVQVFSKNPETGTAVARTNKMVSHDDRVFLDPGSLLKYQCTV